uniref:Uncharacterized protein n=1 Tax=Plectus sambesii TaxID=2011161 RepID=A0A914W682_9BILA
MLQHVDSPPRGSSDSPAQSSNNRHKSNHDAAPRNGVTSLSTSFSLADGQSIAQLLQVAADMDLTFTFNARRSGEYCFEANAGRGVPAGKMIVIADLGADLRVSERVGPEEIDIEMWQKADWQQFLWAVRGKCYKALKSSS